MGTCGRRTSMKHLRQGLYGLSWIILGVLGSPPSRVSRRVLRNPGRSLERAVVCVGWVVGVWVRCWIVVLK